MLLNVPGSVSAFTPRSGTLPLDQWRTGWPTNELLQRRRAVAAQQEYLLPLYRTKP
jgi:hypothetical protein